MRTNFCNSKRSNVAYSNCYTSLVHQFYSSVHQSRMFSKFKIRYTVKPDNKTVVAICGYWRKSQVSKQVPRVGLRWNISWTCLSIVRLGHAYPLSHLSVHHPVRDSENCQWKEISFYQITGLYFNQEQIKLQPGSVKTLIFFFSSSFNITFGRVQRCYHYFFCFNVFSGQTFSKNHFN